MSDDTYYEPTTPEPAAQSAKTDATVTVKALKYHTADGKEYQEGDTYDVDAAKVDNLITQGMVALVA